MNHLVRQLAGIHILIGQALFFILFLAVVSCNNDADRKDDATVRIGLENAPKTLDPRYATDAYGMRITQHLIFNTLVELGYDLQIVPGIAEQWETPTDTTYNFSLRKNIFFHDGKELTAEDVKFTFEHLMDPTTQSPFAGLYSSIIERIDVVSPDRITFELKQPTASFLTSLIMPILPKHLFMEATEFPEKLIGSGPFQFVAQSPTEIVLTSYDRYFEGKPPCDRLQFKIIKDENTRFLKIKKGEIDLVINALPFDKFDEFTKPPLNTTYRIVESPGISYNYVAFNMTDSLLKEVKVRQAIAYGIDVEEIIRYKLDGHAIRATGLLSPANWFRDEGVLTYDYNPSIAAQLLDEVGFPDPDQGGPEVRLTLELKTSNNTEVVTISRVIQSQLAKIGIRIDLKSYEWGTFYGDIKSGNFQLTLMRWVGVTEPDFYFDIFHSSQSPPTGRNRGRYNNPELDDLVQQGRITLVPHNRKEIYTQVQRIVSRELPYISLWHPNNISVVHQRVNGYRQHPMAGFLSFKHIALKPIR